MLEFDFAALSALGLTPALAGRARAIEAQVPDAGTLRLARVTEVHRETLAVHDGLGERSARALPRLVRTLADDETALAVGDWVIAAVDRHDQCWLQQRVPPSSRVVRRDGDGRRHAVVSNVDIALLVMGLDDDFNPRRLERFLALVQDDAIVPVAVLTKRDVAEREPALMRERLDLLRGRLPSTVALHALDATDAAAAATLAPYCAAGATLVLLGSSGAGKSTLTNTLAGAGIQDTGAVREHDGRGRHTTTSRSLHRLPGGACIIDTPGLRTLRPDGDDATLAAAFHDIEHLAARCRFRDCRHALEPGCAVRDGVDADRLRNWHKLTREMRRDAQTQLDRQRQVARLKVQGRAVRARMAAKRGGG